MTSAAIIWTVHALAKYTDAQKKVYDEVVGVVGDRPVEWYVDPLINHLCFHSPKDPILLENVLKILNQ